jgi:hypothetical protein
MTNSSGAEEIRASREGFLRYLEASGKFFEACGNLNDELAVYFDAWEGIDEHVGGSALCSTAEKFEDLRRRLKEIIQGLRDVNDQIEELKGPPN